MNFGLIGVKTNLADISLVLYLEYQCMYSIGARFFLTITIFAGLMGVAACSKLCDSGYEGKRCNVLSTTKFVADWNAIDKPGNIIYTDTIAQGAAFGDITLSPSFAEHHFNHAINASVVLSTITIPLQQPDPGGNYVSGAGAISSDDKQITITYTIASGIDSPVITTNYAGIWIKQN